MPTPIRAGLIGYGLGGRAFHAPFIHRHAHMELNAVVSRDAGKVHADFPEVLVCDDVETLLTECDIDLVVISSPDHLHADHACLALAAGKHVVIDKPLATSLADAGRIAEAGKVAGKLVVPFQNRRWDADFLTLRQLLASGRLGQVAHFESRFDRWRPLNASNWKEARAAGSWQDLGPHLVDQAILLFGMPQAVTADIAAIRPGAPAPDWFNVNLHYDGMRATLHSSKVAADHKRRFAVHGTGGSWIKCGLDPQESAALAGQRPDTPDWGVDPMEGEFTVSNSTQGPERIANRRGNYGAFWDQLADAISGRGPSPIGVEEAIATMRVLEAGIRSADEGRTVRMSEVP